MRAWDWVYVCPCITIFLCQLQIHVVKIRYNVGNPLMEYMKERKDFKDHQRVTPHYFSVTMVKRGRISKLGRANIGASELSSDLYYSRTFLDFIRDYRRDDMAFGKSMLNSLIASEISLLFPLQESTYEVITASPGGVYPKNASEQPLSTNFSLKSLTFLMHS